MPLAGVGRVRRGDPTTTLEVGAGVTAFSLPTPFSIGPVNLFLIDDDPLTLVDCGPNTATALVELEARLAACGRRIEEIGLVVLTHQHSDHSGLAWVIAERSGATVAAHEHLVPYLSHWHAAAAQDADHAYEQMLVHGVDRRVARAVRSVARSARGWGEAARVERPLGDGEPIELAGRTLEAYHLPGHSPSDVLVLDPAAGLAFGGDVLLPTHPSTTVLAAGLDPAWDGARPRPLLDYRNSLRKLAELSPGTVLPGHGQAIVDVGALVEKRLEAQRVRIERTARLLEAGRRSAYELAIFERGEIAFAEVLNALSETLGQLDVLVAEGRAAELDAGDTTTFGLRQDGGPPGERPAKTPCGAPQ